MHHGTPDACSCMHVVHPCCPCCQFRAPSLEALGGRSANVTAARDASRVALTAALAGIPKVSAGTLQAIPAAHGLQHSRPVRGRDVPVVHLRLHASFCQGRRHVVGRRHVRDKHQRAARPPSDTSPATRS